MIELQFETIRRELAEALAGLDPQMLPPSDAADRVAVLSAIEKLAAGGRLVLLARAAQDQRWRNCGELSAGDHLARQAGTSPAAVNEAVKASEQLTGLDATRAAVTGGRLSPQQAAAIASAASKDRAAEAELLRAAECESLSGLRDRCSRVQAAATDQAEREKVQQRNRSFNSWSGRDGSLCGRFSLPAVAGAELLAIFQPFRDQAFLRARREGRHEAYANYAADGFMDLARAADQQRSSHLRPSSPTNRPQSTQPTGTADAPPVSPSRPKARIQVRCDYFALRRGHTQPGEIAEIPGVGPISINTVRDLFDDAIIDILVSKGRDVTTIATNTRYIPQPLRLALAERDQVCFIAGCNRRHRLEHDHQELFSHTHDTSFDNLHRACAHHHDLKTNHGYQFIHTPDGWKCLPGHQPSTEPLQFTIADTGPDP